MYTYVLPDFTSSFEPFSLVSNLVVTVIYLDAHNLFLQTESPRSVCKGIKRYILSQDTIVSTDLKMVFQSCHFYAWSLCALTSHHVFACRQSLRSFRDLWTCWCTSSNEIWPVMPHVCPISIKILQWCHSSSSICHPRSAEYVRHKPV